MSLFINDSWLLHIAPYERCSNDLHQHVGRRFYHLQVSAKDMLVYPLWWYRAWCWIWEILPCIYTEGILHASHLRSNWHATQTWHFLRRTTSPKLPKEYKARGWHLPDLVIPMRCSNNLPRRRITVSRPSDFSFVTHFYVFTLPIRNVFDSGSDWKKECVHEGNI